MRSRPRQDCPRRWANLFTEGTRLDLELAWIRSWLEVVDSGGFARAADRIHLSQPRLSAHVASLEHALGCSLIRRRLRPLTLPDPGKRPLSRARPHVASLADTVTDLT